MVDYSKFMVKLRIAYKKLNYRTNGTIRTVRIVFDRLGKSQSTQAAAAMSFYAFFSIFPLLLLLIGIASFWLNNDEAYRKVMEIATQLLPTAGSLLIEANLQQVIELRGASGSIGIVGFLWSSSSFFAVLARNLNKAQNAPKRNFLEDRAVAIGLVLLLAVFFGLSLLSSTLVTLLPSFDIRLWDGRLLQETSFWKYFLQIIPMAVSFGLFIILYRYVPKRKVSWKSVLISSAFAAIGWQISSKLFSWLINLGYIQYELIYGSLGTVVALMFYIYLISYITLIGAHLSAVLEEKYIRKEVFRQNGKNHKGS